MISVLLFYSSFFCTFILTFRHSAIFAFVLYQLIYFFHPENRWWGSLIPSFGYSFFSVVFMLLILVLRWQETKKNKLLAVPSIRWFYFSVAIYSIVYTWAAIPSYHLEAIIPLIKAAIILSIAFKLCHSTIALDYMLYGYTAGAAYIGYYIFQVGRNAGDRVEGIGMVDSPEANGVAAAIAPASIICLFYFWRHVGLKQKTPFVIAGAIIVNGLVLVNSRGAMLGVAAGAAYLLWRLFFSSVQRKYQKTTVLGIAFAGLVSLLYITDSSTINRIYSISEQTTVNENKETGATRIVFWKAAWTMAKDHPFGLGRGGFEINAPLYIAHNIDTGRSRNRAVHSSWFEALSESGYLGLGSLIMIILSSFYMTKKCKKILNSPEFINDYFKIVCLESMLISYMVSMTFINRMRAEVFLWCVFFIACAFNIYYLRKMQLPTNNNI